MNWRDIQYYAPGDHFMAFRPCYCLGSYQTNIIHIPRGIYEDKQEMKNVPYHEIIGALNWLAVGSCPDIAFVVGQLVQFLENPGQIHWEAAKCI